MIVTVLPSANPEYHCDTQLNHTISSSEVLHRVIKIMSGFGLSINGNHVYCGDFIFSGHTMILILCYLIIVDCKFRHRSPFTEFHLLSSDTPKKLWLLHSILFLAAVGGIVMLMVAKGHYSIDVVSNSNTYTDTEHD